MERSGKIYVCGFEALESHIKAEVGLIVSVWSSLEEKSHKPIYPKMPAYMDRRFSTIFKLSEGQIDSGNFTDLFESIDGSFKRGDGVLIHCLEGLNRSAAVALGYLLHVHDDPVRALRIMKTEIAPRSTLKGPAFNAISAQFKRHDLPTHIAKMDCVLSVAQRKAELPKGHTNTMEDLTQHFNVSFDQLIKIMEDSELYFGMPFHELIKRPQRFKPLP